MRLINARLADRSLATITITPPIFAGVTPQPGPVREEGAVPIGELTTAELPDLVDAEEELIVPAGIDPHIHSRDPGFPDKEDWASVARQAARGGVVAVADMPNTVPATLGIAALRDKAQRAEAAGIAARFHLGILEDEEDAWNEVFAPDAPPDLPLAGVKIYYGCTTGSLVFRNLDLLRRRSERMPSHLPLVFHAEDDRYLGSWTPEAEAQHGVCLHSRLRSPKAALVATEDILRWAATGAQPVHLAHVSLGGEIALAEAARRDRVAVTTEVAPHHLLLNENDYQRLRGRLKVNPPVRDAAAAAELRLYFARGSIDCFATDHAPHLVAEKERPYPDGPAGLPALEFFWPLFYECCRRSGASLEELLPMAGATAARLFGFSGCGNIAAGYWAHFVWLRDSQPQAARASAGKAGWSPYEGLPLAASVAGTWWHGRRVFPEPDSTP